MILVTTGAGFIGSNVVAGLNEAGRTDVAVSDMLGKHQVAYTVVSSRASVARAPRG